MTLLRYYRGTAGSAVRIAGHPKLRIPPPEAAHGDSLVAAILIGLPLLALLALFPWLLRVWETQPLRRGRYENAWNGRRARASLCGKSGVRTGGMVANAAVTGFLPRLTSSFSPTASWHNSATSRSKRFRARSGPRSPPAPSVRVLAIVLPISLWILLEDLWPDGAGHVATWLSNSTAGSQLHVGLAMLAFMSLYVFLVFGAYSRMLEGQADLFGCRVMSNDTSCGHVETFVSALDKLAVVAGVDRNAGSWQHASIAKRVEFLSRVSADPLYEEVFQRRLRWFGGLLAAAVLSPIVYRLILG